MLDNYNLLICSGVVQFREVLLWNLNLLRNWNKRLANYADSIWYVCIQDSGL